MIEVLKLQLATLACWLLTVAWTAGITAVRWWVLHKVKGNVNE